MRGASDRTHSSALFHRSLHFDAPPCVLYAAWRMKCLSCLPGLFIGLNCFNLAASETGPPTQPAPYPPSTLIRAIQWHWDTYQTAADGSDLWPVTWGPDNSLY